MLKLPRNEIRISIISACNMKCVYCHNEGNKSINILSKEEVEKVIIASMNFGIRSVRITGGEPLIHPQIEEICQMLSNKYQLKVGINTNCIEIKKLISLINKGYINRVVVGIDYYNNTISKNSSVGISSKKILNNVLKIKNKQKCNISLAQVYDGNYQNTKQLFSWCVENKVRLKILEVVDNQKSNSSTSDYLYMRDRLIDEFDLDTYVDEEFNEVNGKLDDFNIVSFFHSHCRINECYVCKKMHLRITSDGYFKQCLYSSNNDISIKDGDLKQNIIKAINQSIEEYKQ